MTRDLALVHLGSYELRVYAGRHVALHEQHGIVASAPTAEELYEIVDQHHLTDVVYEFVPTSGTSICPACSTSTVARQGLICKICVARAEEEIGDTDLDEGA